MLKEIVEEVRSYPGLTRKGDLSKVVNLLLPVSDYGETVFSANEDAAVLLSGNEYLLLAVDGMWPKLVEDDPYAAGKASVMVNVNDIYAMGGRPLAMVNVIGSRRWRECEAILEGIRRGCEKFRVPMVGGHYHPDASETSLSVAILGRAQKLLLSHTAQPGQDIVLAVDLDGRANPCRSVLSWDANSGKGTNQILARLGVLPTIAETDLCRTAKDVSNAGLLGTVALLLEASGFGGDIYVDRIPVPPGFPLNDWVKAFLSYGFVLCLDSDKTSPCQELFSQQGITAVPIGQVRSDKDVLLYFGQAKALLFDFGRESITGISPPHPGLDHHLSVP
jgi:selenophosphate synthetase-related protein